MKHRISALANLHLLPETQEEIQKLSDQPVHFPEEFTQPNTEELLARTGNADIVLVSPGTKIDSHYLEAAPTVKYIGLCGTSLANVEVDLARQLGIEVVNVVDYGDEPTAEFTFMQLTRLLRGTGDYQWQENPRELFGKSMGIIGLGAVGKAIANLGLAYGMQMSYFSPSRKEDWEQRGIQYLNRQELLSTNGIIILSSPTNIEVIGNNEFEAIRPNSIIIQVSMGNVFDREGFLEWIAKDRNFAIFDYSAGEENYQIYSRLPRVIFPKIIAGHTLETRQRLGEKIVSNLKDYMSRINTD